jgi:type IV pilus assembly protein PilB
MPLIKTFAQRVVDRLIEEGIVSTQDVENLLEEQRLHGVRLLQLLQERGTVGEEDFVVAIGNVLNTAPINVRRCRIDGELFNLVPRDFCNEHKLVPLWRSKNKLFVALADPLNVLAIDEMRRSTGLDIFPMIATKKSIREKIREHGDAENATD